ncbi:uncharacterized protein SPSC_02910 [Sporisorium scitamineum]|uniref:Uncharacterized protein n=1 Tax=Sporisorium scitamineum TaxID=49012 RepID=A0A0F7S6U3_9BASI|nr:uncharacterized protein SPSC_02910 [Sporisorium scitamineum]CDW98682.1 hypothetical protein [Sporisorium scitamineum]
MSQPGSTKPSTGSQLASTSAPIDNFAPAPQKAPSDDEAEEGEILDEEEGEIPESLPTEPAVSPAAPTQPISSAVTEPAPDSPKQPATPELPATKTVDEDDKQHDDLKPQLATEAPVEDAAEANAKTSQPVEPAEPASESTQTPAEPVPASTSEETKTHEAVQESIPEQNISDDATPTASTEAPKQPAEPAQDRFASQEREDPSTPKLTVAEAPKPESATAASTTVEEQGQDNVVDTTMRSTEDAPTIAEEPSAVEAQPQEAAPEVVPAEAVLKTDEAADIDVDEQVASAPQPASDDIEKPADAVLEPMQVDDSVHTPAVHTPALPSDGLEAPDPAESTIEAPVEDHQEQEVTALESAASPPHVKSESRTEAYDPSQSGATQVPETVPSEPVPIAEPGHQEHPQKEESNRTDFVPRQKPIAEQEVPFEAHQRSATPRVVTAASISETSRPEEFQRHATVERDDASASRTLEADHVQSRTTNRGSAAPSTGQERRSERERTKDRSHPPERSQDREQRAREKDRRRELERLERERERERERIREAERDREMMIARENEEARLIWLSLPGNDHPQYYTDTDSDSCYGVGGALGVDLTDEEDKDLNPPYPLSLQEYHPAPSYSQSYYDDSYYTSKRKRTDDANEVDFVGSSRRNRRKPISKPSDVDRPAPSSSVTVQRQALPSTAMIDIDDFPVPDSSIRSEPSDRPFASRLERASLSRISLYARPEEADEDFESSGSDEEAMRIAEERKRRHGNRGGNRGNKLSRDKGARWVRRGKLGSWTEMRMEKEIGDRVRHRVEAMQKDNVRALLSAMPEEDKAMLSQFPALRDGLLPSEAPSNARRDARGRLLPSDVSEAARIDAELGLDGGAMDASGTRLERPEHLTSTSLAPTLLKPAITPRQLLTSHTLRHTFRNPHIAALGKTALDLIESEGVVGRAVGRCWAAMERGGWNEDPEPKGDEAEESHHQNDVNGMDVDGSDAESSTRHRVEDGGANGASTSVFGSAIDNPALSHLDRLFVTKQGLAIPRLDDMGQPIFVPPSPATQATRAQAGLAEEAAGEPVIETTLLPAPEQRSIVLAALECLHDLAADSREYVDRLEEVRSRLAAVKRRRAQVWNAVRQWALDKDTEASLANGVSTENGASKSIVEAAGATLAAPTLSTATLAANGTSPKKRK